MGAATLNFPLSLIRGRRKCESYDCCFLRNVVLSWFCIRLPNCLADKAASPEAAFLLSKYVRINE